MQLKDERGFSLPAYLAHFINNFPLFWGRNSFFLEKQMVSTEHTGQHPTCIAQSALGRTTDWLPPTRGSARPLLSFQTPNTSTCCSAPRRPQRTLPPAAPLFGILPVISVGPFPLKRVSAPQTHATSFASKRQIPAVNNPVLPIRAITPPGPAIRKGKQVNLSSHNLPPPLHTTRSAAVHSQASSPEHPFPQQ